MLFILPFSACLFGVDAARCSRSWRTDRFSRVLRGDVLGDVVGCSLVRVCSLLWRIFTRWRCFFRVLFCRLLCRLLLLFARFSRVCRTPPDSREPRREVVCRFVITALIHSSQGPDAAAPAYIHAYTLRVPHHSFLCIVFFPATRVALFCDHGRAPTRMFWTTIES